MASEYLIAKDFVYKRLDTALPIQVYEAPAPTAATYPLAVYTFESQPDTRDKNGVAKTAFEVVVLVMGKGSVGALSPHLDALEGALEMVSATVDGLRVTSRRKAPRRAQQYFIAGSNVPTQEIGGRYIVEVWNG